MEAETWRRALAIAARAPSAHNTQPARWRLAGESVELHEDTSRWLRVGDPSGRDQSIGLGMAWESMRLALGEAGLTLDEPAHDPASYPALGVRRRASALVRDGAAADQLAAWQARRHCWRGAFAAPTSEQEAALDAVIARHSNVVAQAPASARAELAALNDDALAEQASEPALAAELWHWLRLDEHAPEHRRDGLSADVLGLSALEAALARLALRPRVLGMLARLRLAKPLVAERARVESATRLVCVHADPETAPFDTGRAWYRFWLDATAHGFAAVPMSALLDTRGVRASAAAALALDEARAITVLRLGPAPAAPIVSARLPLAEIEIAPS